MTDHSGKMRANAVLYVVIPWTINSDPESHEAPVFFVVVVIWFFVCLSYNSRKMKLYFIIWGKKGKFLNIGETIIERAS